MVEFGMDDAVMMIGEITIKERLVSQHLRQAHNEIARLRQRISELAPDDPDGLYGAMEEVIRNAAANGAQES